MNSRVPKHLVLQYPNPAEGRTPAQQKATLVRSPNSLAVLSALLFVIALIPNSYGQSTSTLPRILGPVDEASLVPLRGNVSLKARPEFDQGAAPADTQMTGMHVLLSRSREQEAALNRYMAEQLD